MKNTQRLAGLFAVLIAGSGCAGTVPGEAKPGMTPVDLAVLKTGAMVIEPTTFEMKYSSHVSERVRLIEGRRLLDILVHPIDFIPELTELSFTRIFADANEMSKDGGFPETYSKVAVDNKMVVGVKTVRMNDSSRERKVMHAGVLQFATEQDSQNAAAELSRVATEGDTPHHSVTIPGYPNAHATSPDDAEVKVFQQHGPFVIVTSVRQPEPDAQGIAATIQKVIDQQVAALDKFKVIAPDDLLDLPLDPDGIMRRTTPKSPTGDSYGMSFLQEDFGTFAPSGILHYERNALEVRAAFEEAGVDLVGRRYSTVYRTRDVESAFKLQTVLAKRAKNDAVLDPPPGIADAQCVRLDQEDPNREYNGICVLVYDRYVAVVNSMTLSSRQTLSADPTLQERTAAQYAILKKSE